MKIVRNTNVYSFKDIPCPTVIEDGFNVTVLDGVYGDRVALSCLDGFYMENNVNNTFISYCNSTADWEGNGVCLSECIEP